MPDSAKSGNLRFTNLQLAFSYAEQGDTVLILPGTYVAEPKHFPEPLCGNATQHRTSVMATYGFMIENKALNILGSGSENTILVTNAGYGVLFTNSRGSSIQNLTITGGKRDIDGNATDAGIVIQFSSVRVERVTVRDNTDRADSVVVGIGGVFGRENSELFVQNCVIANNGWDGIALYRGATAYISDNVIHQGRGAGIGVTWDAVAVIQRNSISEYWKGIGAFGSSRVVAGNNLVKNCLGWGIIATGEAYLDATNNNVVHNGNCGLAIWSEECHGRFLNNIVIFNGWKDEWVAPQVGIWNSGKAENFQIYNNDVWGNVIGNYRDMDDLTGKDGNLSVDPLFISETDHHLQVNSPCRDTGAACISEGDGSTSDMGRFGGPGAR